MNGLQNSPFFQFLLYFSCSKLVSLEKDCFGTVVSYKGSFSYFHHSPWGDIIQEVELVTVNVSLLPYFLLQFSNSEFSVCSVCFI